MYDVNKYLEACFQLKKSNTEKILLIILDNELNIVCDKIVGNGDSQNAILDFDKTLEIIKSHGCKHCIISHNHPSGYMEPSEEDDNLTKNFKLFLKKNNVTLVDHIIVRNTSSEYYSYNKHNFVYNANNSTSPFSGFKLILKTDIKE